jgi:hypothetical protein
MLIFEHYEQRVFAATPQAVFGFIGGPARHAELAEAVMSSRKSSSAEHSDMHEPSAD